MPDITVWHGAYEDGWQDVIVPEAFAHPAKMARGLLERIFERLFELGLQKGDLVLDPFGGIGTTALIGAGRGVKVLCCELEPRFVTLARQNVERHRRAWEAMDLPVPVILQGDSRYLRETLDGEYADTVVSSPPYAEIASGAGGLNTLPPQHDGQQSGRSPASASQDTDQRYGDSGAQMAKLPLGSVDAIITSPPYEKSLDTPGRGGIDWSKTADGRDRGRLDNPGVGSNGARAEAYGETPGQLGAMAGGAGIDAIITSPPYEESVNNGSDPAASFERLREKVASGELQTHARDARYILRKTVRNPGSQIGNAMAYGETPGQLGAMPGAEGVDAVVTSPPFLTARSDTERSVPSTHGGPATERHHTTQDGMGYGDTPGNLEALPSGQVDAVVSSPPFTQGYSGGGGINVKGYGPDGADKVGSRTYQGTGAEREPGNLETLTLGDVDAVVSSPPYDAVVSSPPYEGSVNDEQGSRIDRSKARDSRSGSATHSQDAMPFEYGQTDGQLGREEGETFWTAAHQVVQETYAVLKPGGMAVWVVKAFVRDKKLVDFPGDWRRLCEHVGFVTVEEVHASLVAEEAYGDLFDGTVVKRRERKSFFRRLAEKKGSPRIDYEVVYFMWKR